MFPPVSDEAQAYARADEHLGRAKRGFPVPVSLKPGIRAAVPTDEIGEDADARTFVTVEVRYQCEPPEPGPGEDVFARNDGYFTAMEEHWLSQGYQVIGKRRAGQIRALTVTHPSDRFTISLQQGTVGNLWFSASSPEVPEELIDPPAPTVF